jgi:hypothetical protein
MLSKLIGLTGKRSVIAAETGHEVKRFRVSLQSHKMD